MHIDMNIYAFAIDFIQSAIKRKNRLHMPVEAWTFLTVTPNHLESYTTP